MKIGKYEISEGPNMYWWIVTGALTYGTVVTGNWWLIGGWLIFNALIIPISLWLHKWRENRGC